jgi:transposase
MSSPNKKLSDREVAERIAETERIKAETERIRADLKDGMSVAEVLDKYNISRSTLRTRFKGRIPTPSGLTKSELEKVERKEQAVNMYADSLRGLTYKEIAKKYGVSVDTVRTRLDNLDIDLSPALIQSYRQQEFAKLNLLEQRMWKEMDKDYYVVNHGKVIIDPDTGAPMRDVNPILQIADRMLKIADRRAKLGGFDNPVKFEVEHNVSEIQVTEVRDLVEQARREALEQENKLRALALDAAVTEDAEVVDDVEG